MHFSLLIGKERAAMIVYCARLVVLFVLNFANKAAVYMNQGIRLKWSSLAIDSNMIRELR